MALILSKVIPIFIYPLGLALLLMGWALWSLRHGKGRLALAVAIGILWVGSMPLVSGWLRYEMEQHHPARPIADLPKSDVIVVLGGGVARLPSPPRLEIELTSISNRIRYAAKLYKAGKAPRIIVSGGSISWMGVKAPESVVMRELLMEWGVPSDAIIQESRSRNTRENATATRTILDQNGWHHLLLVTSAVHMRRAIGVFRAAGLGPVAATTDVGSHRPTISTPFDLWPNAGYLAGTSVVIREHLGWLYYRLRGWVSLSPPLGRQ
ncbi:MAG: YdcF family protein [Magnetococcales bacterium]|nr:YdcF family protein [Magnetococcales bacterium]